MGVEIRQVRVDEPETVLAVLDALVPDRTRPESGAAEDPQSFLDDPNSFLLAAFDDGRPVGLGWGVHIRYPNGRWMTYLHHLEVEAGRRDAGIGSALMDAALDAARTAGSSKFWLSTGGHNAGAQRLYERLGGDRKERGDVNYWWDLNAGS